MKRRSPPGPAEALAALPEGDRRDPARLVEIACHTLPWAAWASHAEDKPLVLLDLLVELGEGKRAEALCRLAREPARRAQRLGQLARALALAGDTARPARLLVEALRGLPRSDLAGPVFAELLATSEAGEGRVYLAAVAWMRACRTSPWTAVGHASLAASLASGDPDAAEVHFRRASEVWARRIPVVGLPSFHDPSACACFAAALARAAHARGDHATAGEALAFSLGEAAKSFSGRPSLAWSAVFLAFFETASPAKLRELAAEAGVSPPAAELEGALLAQLRAGHEPLARRWVEELGLELPLARPLAARLAGREAAEPALARAESEGPRELEEQYLEGLISGEELREELLAPAFARALLADHEGARRSMLALDALDRERLAARIERAVEAAGLPAAERGPGVSPPDKQRLASAMVLLRDGEPPVDPYPAARDWSAALRLVFRAARAAGISLTDRGHLLTLGLEASGRMGPEARDQMRQRWEGNLCAALAELGRPLEAMDLVDRVLGGPAGPALDEVGLLIEALMAAGHCGPAASVMERALGQILTLYDALALLPAIRALSADEGGWARVREVAARTAEELRTSSPLSASTPSTR